jgi:hypothetical protein
MKTKTLLALTIIALLASSVSFGQSISGAEVKDVSARLDGMSPDFAGLITDEYTDFWIAPYDILNVKGGRLYTNLSNYITGEERQFGDSGAQSSADEYLIGGIYSWENIGTFGLFYRNSYYKNESSEISSGGASDPVYVSTSVAEEKAFAIPLFYGRKITDQLSFGVKIAYLKDDYTSDSFSESAATPTSPFDPVSESHYADNFHYWTITPGLKYEINPDWAIGGQFVVGQEKESWDNTNISYSEGISGYNNSIDLKGTGWGIQVQSWYRLNDATKLRGFISYNDIPLKGDGDYINVGTEAVDAFRVDEKDKTFAIGVGSETKLNEKLMLALGIKYINEKYTDEYSEGAPVYYTDNYEEKFSELILPVGLEYTMTDWLTFRMGASHKIMTDRNTETESDIVSGTVVDQTTSVSKDDNSETTYYYGAGLNVTENLTIDLLGWRNLTDLNNWKLSATVKF